jgi:DNA polymerase-3 subunit epsilon
MRQIVLDTETTGLEPSQGHRIIEIGCVELINRRTTGNTFQRYLNPQRSIDPGAQEVHGLSNEYLEHKPFFADVVADFLEFIKGSELIIHNAPFDIGFLNNELQLAEHPQRMEDLCHVLDTLALARSIHPGQRNSLDALCKRYEIDDSNRELHGALLDARILADVYLIMTGGQAALSLDAESQPGQMARQGKPANRIDRAGLKLVVIKATDEELSAHQACLETIEQASENGCLWNK